MGTDNYFAPLGNTNPYVSMGFQGKEGSGKSHTAALVARGLHKQIGSTKPITVFATESKSHFLGPVFDDVDAQVRESRSLPDLMDTIQRCIDGASDILVVDSITEVWEQFLSTYSNGGRNELTQHDYVRINTIWRDYIWLPIRAARIHVLFTIREGYMYDKTISAGKTDYTKTGTKRRMGNDFGYEPDVLIQMTVDDFLIGQQRGKSARRFKVLKGPNLLDGITGTDPTYEDFHKYISFVLDNPVAKVETESRSNDQLIAEENAVTDTDKETLIAIERNRELIESIATDDDTENRTTRLALTFTAYKETSRTAINSMTAAQHGTAFGILKSMIDSITLVRQWERLAFPTLIAIDHNGSVQPISQSGRSESWLATRIEKIGTGNLGESTPEKLSQYYEFLKAKHNKDLCDTDA